MLTQAELKKHLHYDPETGVFTRAARKAAEQKYGFHANHGRKATEVAKVIVSVPTMHGPYTPTELLQGLWLTSNQSTQLTQGI